ncbi:MAG: hypothetical protein ABSC19_01990 [Syntrophorhabdales bacterium]|jgi:hypothetical protein
MKKMIVCEETEKKLRKKLFHNLDKIEATLDRELSKLSAKTDKKGTTAKA